MSRDMTLGSRMKRFENQYGHLRLLDKVPAVARIDGKCFHNFCRSLPRPYDERLSQLMVETTKYLVEETNAHCGYTQSDEISLIWHEPDFNTFLIFDGRVLKLTSILAAMATAKFNQGIAQYLPEKVGTWPIFDARVYSVPTREDAIDYLKWREWDATRNSVAMASQSVYSHKQLHKKNISEQQEMLFAKGINWNDYPAFFKRGTYVQRQKTVRRFTTEEIAKLPPLHNAHKDPNLVVERTDIVVIDMPPLAKVTNPYHVIFDSGAPQV